MAFRGDFKLKDSDAFFRESHLGVKPDKIDLTKMVSGGPQSFDFDYSFATFLAESKVHFIWLMKRVNGIGFQKNLRLFI